LHVRERLRPVADERVGRRGPVGTRPRTDRHLVVDEERRAELAREVGRRDAAERERAVLDPGGVGEELEHRPILPGAVSADLWRDRREPVTLRRRHVTASAVASSAWGGRWGSRLHSAAPSHEIALRRSRSLDWGTR